jgi:hypothetical protein
MSKCSDVPFCPSSSKSSLYILRIICEHPVAVCLNPCKPERHSFTRIHTRRRNWVQMSLQLMYRTVFDLRLKRLSGKLPFLPNRTSWITNKNNSRWNLTKKLRSHVVKLNIKHCSSWISSKTSICIYEVLYNVLCYTLYIITLGSNKIFLLQWISRLSIVSFHRHEVSEAESLIET